ncbi:hypothetical protein HQ865_14020 [Mucilaginibacter mali]|uniref:Lipocalin-like domain-containing protein n=1 Tax=Mucilaginibacter mali TaxID=2740462 RepID=A0A7D4TXZ0_9SPHI|nr:hypothetical protein [Mucilaginibacter mali]QKJ30817.1 hypothetical protein HQ865_14020 [Mucilaginibacter mali]
MKKAILTITIVSLWILSSSAQTRVNGTWVVESNIHQPKLHTVKFYGDSNRLLYTETIKGRLNIDKKKVRDRMNKVLDILLAKNNDMQNSGVLAAAFKLKL